MPRLQGSNHIILTVTDVERSAEWYKRVFVADVVADEKTNLAATSRPVRYRALFRIDTMTNVVGLIEHSDADHSHFDERRVGLDHFALHVLERHDLEEWVSTSISWGSRTLESNPPIMQTSSRFAIRTTSSSKSAGLMSNSGLVVSPVSSPIHPEPRSARGQVHATA